MKGKQKKEAQQRPEEGTTVALYARVSTEKQDVDLSVAAQLRALRDHAGKNGYAIVGEYIDEAESGRIAERPQFRRMITDATGPNAPFKEILVWKFSRFTRKREHAVAFKSMLRRRGIKVVSITEHADDTPTGKLMEAIIESVDEFYSENLAQEVLRGMREAASRGFWMGNYAPLGYKRVHVDDGGKKRPKLALNESTAAHGTPYLRPSAPGKDDSGDYKDTERRGLEGAKRREMEQDQHPENPGQRGLQGNAGLGSPHARWLAACQARQRNTRHHQQRGIRPGQEALGVAFIGIHASMARR